MQEVPRQPCARSHPASHECSGGLGIRNREQARRLFASFEGASDVVSLRDLALLSLMLYGLVRVGGVVRMRVRDFQLQDDNAWLVLYEKGGKQRRLPVEADGPSFGQRRAPVHPRRRALRGQRGPLASGSEPPGLAQQEEGGRPPCSTTLPEGTCPTGTFKIPLNRSL